MRVCRTSLGVALFLGIVSCTIILHALIVKWKNQSTEEEMPELERKVPEMGKKSLEMGEKKPKSENVTSFCSPKTNILFLKTHKTASTAIMNLLFHFADKNQLIMAHPSEHYALSKFTRCMILGLQPGYEYNIMTLHTVFNYEEMRAVMPDDTKFITVLRDPVAQFESAYSYFTLENTYGMTLTEFADLDTSDRKWSSLKDMRNEGALGRNQVAFDLGIDPQSFDDQAAILDKVLELDRQFDVVVITELFDESLILLKGKLCWNDTRDVMVFEINSRNEGSKVELSSERKRKLREKNAADQIIYDHFRRKLLRQIDEFGKERMEREVEGLRSLTQEIKDACVVDAKFLKSDGKRVPFRLKIGAEWLEKCRHVQRTKVLSESIYERNKSKFVQPPIECATNTT